MITALTGLSIFNRNKPYLYACLKLIILTILFNLTFTDCAGQVVFTVSQPRLTLLHDSLIIKYDILGADSDDKFNVRLEISDAAGNIIYPYSVKGDIGENINAGINKQITWNLSGDNIFLNTNINVEIIAKKIIIPVTVSEEEDVVEIIPDEEKKEKIKKSSKDAEAPGAASPKVKTGKHLLQSAVFPGWGLTSLCKGKPYWLIGVAGAGCIASSIYFNHQAYSNYNNYLDTNNQEKIDTYFDNAKTQDNISKAFAWSAAAIWVVDLGIVGIKAGRMKKSYAKNKLSAFSISSCIDPNTDTPMLSLYYNF